MELDKIFVVINNEEQKIKVVNIFIKSDFSKHKDWWVFDLPAQKQKEHWIDMIELGADKKYLIYGESQCMWFFISENELLKNRYINSCKQLPRTEITIEKLEKILNK